MPPEPKDHCFKTESMTVPESTILQEWKSYPVHFCTNMALMSQVKDQPIICTQQLNIFSPRSLTLKKNTAAANIAVLYSQYKHP